MNRNFKRVLAGLAALTLCVGVVPHSMPSVVSNMAVVASAADETPTSEFTFDKETGTISRYNGNSDTVVVPSEIDGVAVKKLTYGHL